MYFIINLSFWNLQVVFFPHLRTLFSLLWEKEREGERGISMWERNMNWPVAFSCTPHWASKLWPFCLWDNAPTKWVTAARCLQIFSNRMHNILWYGSSLIYFSKPHCWTHISIMLCWRSFQQIFIYISGYIYLE